MDFNLQVPNEEEADESVSEDEADHEVFSDAPSLICLPGEAEAPIEAPTEACSSLSLAGALPSNLYGSEARTTKAARPQTFRPLCIIFSLSYEL